MSENMTGQESMTSIVRRSSRLPEVFHWLRPELPFGDRRRLRVEDFIIDGRYVVRAELPGVDPDSDVTVSVTGGNLNIDAIRAKEDEDRKGEARSEFRYGTYSRSIQLPPHADIAHIEAHYHAGILEVTIPVADVPVVARDIPITTG